MLQWWLYTRWMAEAKADALARVDLVLGLIGAALLAAALAA